MIRFFGAFVVTLAVVGCAPVGPDYHVPDQAAVKLPEAQGKFMGGNSPAVTGNAPLPDGWWQLYHDDLLNGLVAEALHANTDIRIASANLARANAVRHEADAARRVDYSVSAAVEHARESGEAYLLPTSLPVDNLADAGVGISYEVDIAGRLKRAIEAAGADVGVAAAGLDLARVTIAAGVTRSYLEVCAANAQGAIARHSVDLQKQHLAVVKAMQAAGRGTSFDVTRAQALAESLQAIPPVFEARRQTALYMLAALTGKPPAEYSRAAFACNALPQLDRPIPIGDGAALLRRRPDVRQAERMLAGATARIGVATAALYPHIHLGFSAGSTGLLDDIGTAPANRWSIGPLISWTIPVGGERARIRAAGATADAALAHFDGVVLQALRETESRLTVYARELDRNAALSAARDDELRAHNQAEILYRDGRTPFINSLDAQRELANAEAALAASKAQLASDQVALFLALGGGWNSARP